MTESSYCTFFKGNLVTWRSKKLSIVVGSTVETEFRPKREYGHTLLEKE